MKKCLFILSFLWAVIPNTAQAIIVNLEGMGQGQKFPIMVVSKDEHTAKTEALNEIIRADLARSGLFEIIMPDRLSHSNDAIVPYVVQTSQEEATISAQLYHYHNQDNALNTFTATAQLSRELAHLLSNQIFESITGIKGVFHTKIAYASGNQLILADADGQNAQVLVQSQGPISSPAWSPQGHQIAYVDYQHGKPNVYIYDLRSGEKRLIAQYTGNNSAPAFSADGKTLAITLSQQGIANIYRLDPNHLPTTPLPLQVTPAINTEAVFSPQGDTLIFTSDRTGEAQIYRLSLTAQNAMPQRLSFQGKKNMNPAISHDGKTLAYASLHSNQHYQIAIQTLPHQPVRFLTADPRMSYFSPSFSPNDTQVIYTSSQGSLIISNTDGSFQTTLPSTQAVNSVAWGPL